MNVKAPQKRKNANLPNKTILYQHSTKAKSIPLELFKQIQRDCFYLLCEPNLLIIPQASFSPALPDGCDVKSSGLP